MARKKADMELEKVTVNLGKGDFSRLGALHPTLGASVALRVILRAYLTKVESRVPSIDLQLPNLEELLPNG